MMTAIAYNASIIVVIAPITVRPSNVSDDDREDTSIQALEA
jgi:hypothetical protein